MFPLLLRIFKNTQFEFICCIYLYPILLAERFSTPVQTVSGVHSASYTMGTRSFPEGKQTGKKRVKYPRYRPTWPRGVQEVKAPRFHDPRHKKMVRSSSLRTGRLYPQEYPGTHFLEAGSTPGTWTCRMLRKKSSVTRPRIDSGTLRLVAQGLNHYITPGPKQTGIGANHQQSFNAVVKERVVPSLYSVSVP